MGFQFRRRIGGRHVWLNVSRHPSVSVRVGRVTVSSRGTFFVRVLRGLFYRGSL